MSMPSDPQAAALLSHIISQTQRNIEFLTSQNYITDADAAAIFSRLPEPPQNRAPLINEMQSMRVSSPMPPPGPPGPLGSPGPRRNIPPPPPRGLRQARALWAYNEDGREPNDLSFSSGEIIEIIDETNADWWTGKCRGRQGLFPSNYVEKIHSSPSPHPPPPRAMPAPQPSYYPPPDKAVYQPPYQAPMAPPPSASPNVVVVQEAPPQAQKKSRFGGLGNTMATAAAGGLGFGAGAAIGGDLVNSIF